LVSTSHGAGGYLSSSVRFSKVMILSMSSLRNFVVLPSYVIGVYKQNAFGIGSLFLQTKIQVGILFRKNTNHGIEVILLFY
jgi:hypothetical protein